MIFLLSKLVLFFIKPLVWVFALFLFAFFTKKKERQLKLVISGFIVLFIFSNAALVNNVFYWYEGKYETYQKYDVGIVLGGFSHYNQQRKTIEFNQNGDRLFQAIYLYRKGVIKKILVSGGSIEKVAENKIESNNTARYLREIGIPDSVILVENKSRNTIENVANSYKMMTKMMPKAKILVITSAFHIPRVKMIFSKYFGDQLTYYPTDFRGSTENSLSAYLIPNAGALASWDFLFKEWLGLLVDRFRI